MPAGKKLAAERRSQGKSISDIVASTKIMSRMLESLENERWDELPASSYVKGYIQNYAHALGLDAKPFVEEYLHDIGAAAAAAPTRPRLEHIPERAVVPHSHDLHVIPRKAIIGVAVAVLVVVLALWGISALASRDETPPPIAPETTTTPTASGVGDSEATSESTVPSATTEAPEGAFELAVTVTPGESSWVRVLVDGLVAYEGTMPGGESKSWIVTTSAVIRAGKPAALTVMRDGTPVTFSSAGEGIAELTLSASDE